MRERLYLAVLLVIVAPVFFSCATNSGALQSELYRETVLKEIEVGRAALSKIAGTYGILRDDTATAYLNKFFQSLALYGERQELEYFVGILETEQVNAYSLPGGYVLVTLGALKAVDSPAALAGILAHELGHINRRHILEQVEIEVRYSFFETLARMLAGSRQVITQAMDQINQKIEERLFFEGFAAEDEYEADSYAVRLLSGLGISSRPFIGYLSSLASGTDTAALESLDRTHPPLVKRLECLEKIAPQELPEPVLSEEFRSFKRIIDAYEVKE